MQCKTNKWCGWIQSIAQIAVAVVILYAGYIVNKHMEAWTEAFTRGSDDLHSIQQSMRDIDVRMQAIEQRMSVVNNQMYHMNSNVGAMRSNMTPMGMMRSFMPW